MQNWIRPDSLAQRYSIVADEHFTAYVSVKPNNIFYLYKETLSTCCICSGTGPTREEEIFRDETLRSNQPAELGP